MLNHASKRQMEMEIQDSFQLNTVVKALDPNGHNDDQVFNYIFPSAKRV